MKYFTEAEFACKCGCGFKTIDPKLGVLLDAIREHFDTPCIVNSGCRCKTHNKNVGGAQKTATSAGSQHLYGRAADIVLKGIPPALVAEVAIQLGATGTKVYDTFTHVDVRSGHEWHA